MEKAYIQIKMVSQEREFGKMARELFGLLMYMLLRYKIINDL